jgi:DNA polymerase elongation subunit (family B)
MYVHGEKVEAISIQKALLDFLEFLSVLKEPILISHNICNFDIPILIRKLKESNLRDLLIH